MANCKREITYRCLDDCRMSGCPSHKGILEFQSCSEIYHFIMDGEDYYFDTSTLQAMVDLVKMLNREDTVNF